MNLPRYIRTLRHLRWSQLFGQVRAHIAQRLISPSTVKSRGWSLDYRKAPLNLSAPVPAQDARALAAGKFEFVGEQVKLGPSPDWEAIGRPRLWRYNLHYFDWLWSLLDAVDDHWEKAKDLTLDWIECHPPKKGACGWEPYPTSLRLINWCLLYGLKHQDKLAADSAFRDTLLDSIGRQVVWLERNLETHIQANHLLENLCALLCVSFVLKGPDRIRLQRRYRPKIAREILEQILPDGMHYERSPMYHLRVMWLMEMLKEVGDSDLQKLVRDPLELANKALVCLSHPDGEIAQFNDAAIGIYTNRWQEEPVFGSWSLPYAGYYGYRDKSGNCLIVDAGIVGPDYQPGHAHADYLSFELSMHGHRMITDTGISTYETGTRRSYDRSTAAHSTVEIAGQNSAEVWSSFRVGRRVTPEVLEWSGDGVSECVMFLKAKHNGYKHLPCKAVHSRSFKLTDEGLEIRDSIQAAKETTAISRLHFAPECELIIGLGEVQIDLVGRKYRCVVGGDCEMSLEHHPTCLKFGMDVSRNVLVMKYRLKAGKTKWKVRIEPALTGAAVNL